MPETSIPENAQVRLKNSPTRVGRFTGRTMSRRDRVLLQVQWPDFQDWQYEQDLEPVASGQLGPLDLLEQGRLSTPADLRRTLTHARLTGRLADVIYSMEATKTEFLPYQFKPVLKILETPANGILITDEVGLGKTIEAGLIWTELRTRYDLRRLVVLCPASLREKWRFELSDKFGVVATPSKASDALQMLSDRSLAHQGFAIVCSHQGMRPPRKWRDEENVQPTARLARFLEDNEADDPLIDLLVIDEAHHFRNEETLTHQLGRLMTVVSKFSVLLTATPIHNKNDDLFSLARLLDPDTFSRREEFFDVLAANEPLVRAREEVLKGMMTTSRLRELVREAMSHPLLAENRQLSSLVGLNIDDDQLRDHETRSSIAYQSPRESMRLSTGAGHGPSWLIGSRWLPPQRDMRFFHRLN